MAANHSGHPGAGAAARREHIKSMLRSALGIWLCGSVTAWMWGPFGTFIALDNVSRLVYWAAIVGIGTCVGLLVRVLVSLKLDVGAPRGILTVAALQTASIGPAIWAVNQSFFLVPDDHLMTLSYHIVIAGNVCFIIALIRLWTARSVRLMHSAVPERALGLETIQPAVAAGDSPQMTGLRLRGVIADLDGEIMHVRADGHYTILQTAHGSARVLLRFSDVLSELGALEGLRVHRSHWVARRAIAQVERDGPRHFVVLQSGCRVPVSRTYQANLLAENENA